MGVQQCQVKVGGTGFAVSSHFTDQVHNVFAYIHVRKIFKMFCSTFSKI